MKNYVKKIQRFEQNLCHPIDYKKFFSCCNRDGIQLVHDQTVRYMNKGLYPNEITRKVYLPPYLTEHPFLQEFYGTVEWSIKAVFANYMGWFSGKVTFRVK